MEKGLLSIQGRITVGQYWGRWAMAIVVDLIVAFGLADASPGFALLGGILNLATGIFIIIQGVKRMHDVDKSGWYLLIPLYNLILLLSPGTKGPNSYDYGTTPYKTHDDVLDSGAEMKK